tara:strand:- start:1693 stop:2139 length:447 start_codon:yes stop_codon:yes gene_type:complete
MSTFRLRKNSQKTLDRLEDLMMRKKFRTEMTKGIWYKGPTGVGKSHIAFQNFDSSTHYLVNLGDKGWYEGYKGQDTVIINDFRGEIPYDTLLQMVDKWPFSGPRRISRPISRITSGPTRKQIETQLAIRAPPMETQMSVAVWMSPKIV